MIFRTSSLLSYAVLALACTSPGEVQYTTGRQADVTPDGLHRIQTWGSMAARVYVKPGVDLSRYDKVMLDPVVVRFGLGTSRTLDANARSAVQKAFESEFRGQLGKSTVYTLVSEPGADVLRLTPELADVVVTAPRQPDTPDSDFYVQQTGAVTLALLVTDSLSHAVLVRAYDRQAVEDPSGLAYRSTPGANLANARLIFRQWASRIRGWLDQVRAIPPLPAGEASQEPAPQQE
jgi:hypothetical protein